MNFCRSVLVNFILFILMVSQLQAQSWDFIKEKEGIKLYTRAEPGQPIKAFKGVTDIKAPAGKIFEVLRDINNTDWWDKNVNLDKVLYYDKNKGGRYYLVYDLPWPLPDRDLCVDISVSAGKDPGERMISAASINGIIPERGDLVRIKNYRQMWTVRSQGEKITHVELEGLVDPAGNIPDWIINMLIIESPYKSISGLKKRLMSD